MIPSVPSVFLALALASGASPIHVTGTVVDQHGAPLPRVWVHASQETVGVFTTTDGTFSLDVADAASCRIEAALAGFETASLPCGTAADLRFVLRVQPIAETVVVSATRTDAPSGQVTAGVTVFDRDEIERRQTPSAAALLRLAPGASVIRSGGAGAVTSLFVRGGESSYNKILLDGIPLNEPGGTFDLSALTTDNLERVEMVRGANSALFGSDAMTSVVQLFTRRGPRDGYDVAIAAEGGSFGTGRGSASLAGGRERFDYSAAIAREQTDNDVPNSAFRETVGSFGAGVRLGQDARLRMIGRASGSRAGTPGQTAFGRPDLDARFDRRDVVVGATFEQQIASTLRQRATYGLSTSRQTSVNLVLDPPYTPRFGERVAPFEFFDFPFDSRNTLRRHHGSYQVDWTNGFGRAGDHIDTALVDWDGERGTLDDRLDGSRVMASRDNVGLTLQHQAMWPRLFITAGIRFEHNDSFGGAAVPRVGAAWVARRGAGLLGETTVKANAGLGIKEPTLLQSFSPSPFFLGNPDLEPERSRALDAGIEQRLLRDRARVSLTWFDNHFDDQISTRTLSTNPFRAQYFNIGEARARGLELLAEAAAAYGLHVRGGYTFLDSRILRSTSAFDPAFAVGQWVFRRPRHSGFVDAWVAQGRVTAGVTGVFVGRRVDSDFSSLDPPITSSGQYAVWDLRATVAITPRASLTAAIDNLTDAVYMEPLGYDALGRAVRGGVRLRF